MQARKKERRKQEKNKDIIPKEGARPWIGKQYEFRGTWPTYPDLVS